MGTSASDSSAWPTCRSTLSCDFEVIAALSMSERLDYVRYMQSYFFITLNADNQFRNIEGVITFFMNNDLGPAESWVSYVDAGIVEGVQRGGAIVLGMSDETGDNPGTTYWTSFLRGMRDGELGDRDVSTRPTYHQTSAPLFTTPPKLTHCSDSDP